MGRYYIDDEGCWHDGSFKIDMRVLNDSVVQRYNEENDLTVAEAAKNDPGSLKYQSDRCKLFSESKVIINNFLEDAHDVNTVYSIQFCGFEMIILSLSLSANGFYVGDEVHHVHIDNRLENFRNYLRTGIQLLCFRDEAIKLNNEFDRLKTTNTSKSTSVKGSKYNKCIKDVPTKVPKSSWKRGIWVPPRRKESPIPAIPNNLVSQ